jgi:hypothetical protein
MQNIRQLVLEMQLIKRDQKALDKLLEDLEKRQDQLVKEMIQQNVLLQQAKEREMQRQMELPKTP